MFAILSLTIATLSVLNTLSADFEREFVERSHIEKIKGRIYYQAPAKVIIEVNDSLNQITLFTRNSLLIYYPEEARAFRIKSKGPMTLPFFEAFIGAVKEDFGLTELGYTLADYETCAETLYTWWDPPEHGKKFLGMFVLGNIGNRLVYAEAKTPQGECQVKSFFKNHIQSEGEYFPLEIYSEHCDGIKTEEQIVYSNVEFNVSLPESLVNFVLPDSVMAKEIEW